jgi:hypothetical protein
MRISSMKTKTHFLIMDANIEFIAAWNVAGVLVRPKGMTLNSYRPW